MEERVDTVNAVEQAGNVIGSPGSPVAQIWGSRLDLNEVGFRAAKASVVSLGILLFLGAVVYNACRRRCGRRSIPHLDIGKPTAKLTKTFMNSFLLGRSAKITVYSCSAGFIGYWSRSVLSIVIISLAEELHLSETTMATALSAFFYGYIIANICSVRVMAMVGARCCLFCAIFGSSVATLAMPPVISIGGAHGLIFCRGLIGLLQGMLYPSIYSVWAGEFMHDEKAKTRALSFMGAMPALGIASNFLVSPLLIQYLGWRYTVYSAGLLGVPWSVLWWISPLRHEPDSTNGHSKGDEECSPAENKLNHSTGILLVRDILCTPTFYAIVCGTFAHSWMTYVVMAWLPMYLRQELGVSGESLSLSCLPYAITVVAGPTLCMSASWLLNNNDLWKFRRKMGMAALLVPATGTLIFPRIPGPFWPLHLAVIGIALAFTTLVSLSVLATPLDVAGPQTAGLLYSMANIAATVPGFLGVQVVGALRLCCGWPSAFASCTCIYLLAACVYARKGSAHRIFD